jgi:hypothetical protein
VGYTRRDPTGRVQIGADSTSKSSTPSSCTPSNQVIFVYRNLQSDTEMPRRAAALQALTLFVKIDSLQPAFKGWAAVQPQQNLETKFGTVLAFQIRGMKAFVRLEISLLSRPF